MEISCRQDNEDFVICVRDWGASFDPDSIPTPDVTAPLEERTLGGLGLYLIRRYMDQVRFDFDPVEGNQLTMRKRLQADTPS
jgi:serine/threonine-protein kinase RsbW